MRNLLLAVTALFSLFSGWVIWQTGLVGFFTQLFSSPAGWQIFADICIALFLVLSWIHRDASQLGRRFWPWVALTVTLGSIGPLLYLLGRPREAQARAAAP